MPHFFIINWEKKQPQVPYEYFIQERNATLHLTLVFLLCSLTLYYCWIKMFWFGLIFLFHFPTRNFQKVNIGKKHVLSYIS